MPCRRSMPGSPSRGLEQSLAIAPWSLRAVLEGFPYIITSDSEPLLSSSGPLVAERWKFWLSGHPDHRARFLIVGIVGKNTQTVGFLVFFFEPVGSKC